MKNKYLPYIIFGVPLLIGAFFVYKYVKANKKGESAPPNHEPNDNITTTNDGGGGGKPTISKYFPLKKGSKGAKVTETQKALLNYDSGILPKFGADGDFGNETMNAVQKVLGKTTIDSQEDINAIIKKADEKNKNEKTNKAVAEANSSRVSLAQKLVGLAKGRSGRVDFYALHDTEVVFYDVNTDGTVSKQKTIVLKKNDKIKVDIDTIYKIGSNGTIQAYLNKKLMKSFSPYAFEVR